MIKKFRPASYSLLAVAVSVWLAFHLHAQPATVDATKADSSSAAEITPPSDTTTQTQAPSTLDGDTPAVVPAPPAAENLAPPPPKTGKRTKNRKASKFQGISKEEVNVAGADYTLPAGQEVRSVTVTKGTATIDGDVRHDVVMIDGDVTISGHVGGDVVTLNGNLKLSPTAKVDGNAISLGGALERDAGAQVLGEVVELGPRILGKFAKFINAEQLPNGWQAWVTHCLQLGRLLSFDAGWTLAINFVFLLFYLLLLLLFPGAVHSCRNAVSERPINTIIFGIAGIPLIVCAMLLLLATGVGIIAWPFLIAASIVASYLGKISLLVSFGTTLARPVRRGDRTPAALALALGWLVVSFLYLVPFLAFIVWFSLALWGLGIALSAISHSTKRAATPVAPGKAPAPPASAPSAPPASPIAPTRAPVVPVLPVMSLAVAGGSTGPTVTAGSFSAPPPVHPNLEEPLITQPEPPPLSSSTTFAAELPSASTTPPEAAIPLSMATQKRPKSAPRWGALAIDCLVIVGVIRLTNLESPLLNLAIIVGYQWGMLYWRGATLGAVLCHLKVVRMDGRPVNVSIAGVRACASILSIFSCGLGWLWPLWDREKQTWHDKLAGTVVVQLERPEPLI